MNPEIKVYNIDPVYGANAKDGRLTEAVRVGHITFRRGIAVSTVLDACRRAYLRWMSPDDNEATPEKFTYEQIIAANELISQKEREFVPYSSYQDLRRQLSELQTQYVQLVRSPVPSFQQRVWEWFRSCFGPQGIVDHAQRDFRFYEEATELVQARGNMSREDCHRMVDAVYDKEPGDVYQEVGGVSTTFAMICNSAEIDMDHAADTELLRVWGKQDEIREKQKQKLHPKTDVTPRLYADD